MAKKKSKSNKVLLAYGAAVLFAILVIVFMSLAYLTTELTVLGTTQKESFSGFKLISETAKDSDSNIKAYLIISIILSSLAIIAAGLGAAKVLKVKNMFVGAAVLGLGVVMIVMSVLVLTEIKTDGLDLGLVKAELKIGIGAILQLICSVLVAVSGAGVALLDKK